MIEKLLLTFGIATALSLSAPDAAAAPKGGDLTGDAFLKEVPASKLYEKFRTPDSSSKLFARWWWNGTRVAGWNWSTSPCAKPPRAACTVT